jgi:hypothetical protein
MILFKRTLSLIYLISLIYLAGCEGTKFPGGKITIRNDILDKEYNSFQVDQIMTPKGIASFTKVLNPNDRFVLPFKSISAMRFVRRYSDHSKVYLVSCDPDANDVLVIKLIDVHTNKLGGTCKLNKRGTMSKGGFVKWE